MKKLYQTMFATGALIGYICLNGCNQSKKEYLEGTVKEEFGTAQSIVESNGALFGNESIKFGKPNYGLVLEAVDGTYVLSVREYIKPIYALAKAIEPGDKVRINYDPATRIGKDNIGRIDSDTIELIEKAK